MMRRHDTPAVALIALLGLAFSCSSLSGCAKRPLMVRVTIEPGANQNSPVALDIVRVDNKDLVKELSKLTAADWFAKRDQYQLDYPKSSVLSIISREWVPGQPIAPIPTAKPPLIPVPFLSSKAATLLFANYFTPGPHRAEFLPGDSVDLGENDLKIVPGGKSFQLPEKK